MRSRWRVLFGFALAMVSPSLLVAFEGFVIRVVDQESRRPVPLVELRTTNQVRYITDNHGLVAISDPDLLGRKIYFSVSSHGYEYPQDGFGMVGCQLQLSPGVVVEIEVKRTNIAERLYRITGDGRTTHARRSGRDSFESPGANVFGCDSVLNAIYDERLFWIWGDTNRPDYPLGNFHSTGATSTLPWDPENGIELSYYRSESGFVRPMAKMPGKGPTWLTGLTVLKDQNGKEHLGAMYQKVKGFLNVYETGLCEFDPETEKFERLFAFDAGQKVKPRGHPFRYADEAGKEWMIYGDPLPAMRIPASYEAWRDPSAYEALSVEAKFVDPESGETVEPHRGSISWNQYRKRWIMIFCETRAGKKSNSTSRLGEIWYAESVSPMGPWTECRKVVSHNKYSFYNPKQHPYYAAEEGRVIYFEGTYTVMFSETKQPTPRYDYNQILYRLDLDDPRLKLSP